MEIRKAASRYVQAAFSDEWGVSALFAFVAATVAGQEKQQADRRGNRQHPNPVGNRP